MDRLEIMMNERLKKQAFELLEEWRSEHNWNIRSIASICEDAGQYALAARVLDFIWLSEEDEEEQARQAEIELEIDRQTTIEMDKRHDLR